MQTYVTKPFLPPFEEVMPSLEKIWDSRFLSNGGPFHRELEDKLCEVLKVKHISLVSNGTLGLLVALRSLELEGAEIITTPYSFVATSSSLIWTGNKPVFVDIDPESANIDPSKIEQAITSKTKAIVAVHCYGHPCDSKKIQAIADKHDLKVIYDAAHAFGIETENGSLLSEGDLSVLSFHATKVFNTFEGGAIVCGSPEMKQQIDRLKNFGIDGETNVTEFGINAKMNEFNAAIGVAQLKHFPQVIAMRAKVDNLYRDRLQNTVGIECLENTKAQVKNHAYFPILVKESYSCSRDGLYDLLKSHNIYSRRYFYPLISDFEIYKKFLTPESEGLPVAHQIAEQILCLPIFPELPLDVVEKICDIIQY